VNRLSEQCTGAGYIKLNLGTPDMDAAFQLVLAAYNHGYSVTYRVHGCSYYPLLYNVQLE
jgi:hypothetical protein